MESNGERTSNDVALTTLRGGSQASGVTLGSYISGVERERT